MPLENAVNDARAMAGVLAETGFEVTSLLDVGLRSFETTLREWAGGIGVGDVAVFFYAGHGMQVDGINYLVPVDFDARDEIDVKYEGYCASRVLEQMETLAVGGGCRTCGPCSDRIAPRRVQILDRNAERPADR